MDEKRFRDKKFIQSEIDAVLAVADEREKALFRFLLDTGLKVNRLELLESKKIRDVSDTSIELNQQDKVTEIEISESTAEKIREYISANDFSENEAIFGDGREIRNTIKDLLSLAHVKIGEDLITEASPKWFRYNKVFEMIEAGKTRREIKQKMGVRETDQLELFRD